MPAMSTRSRQTIYGGRIIGAKIRAQGAREAAQQAIREPTAPRPDRAEAEAWSIQMEVYGEPAQPSPTIAQCLNGGYGWLEVATAARPARASRSMRSAVLAIRRFGNWRRRGNAGHARKGGTRRPFT
jgi:hypothetical protein